MKTADFNNRIVDGYLELLKKLDPSSKLDLISKLTKSLKSDHNNNKNSFEKAFGAWDKSEDAEKIIKEVRRSRKFNREIEDL